MVGPDPGVAAAFCGLQRAGAERRLEASPYLLDVEADGRQRTGWIGGRSECGPDLKYSGTSGGRVQPKRLYAGSRSAQIRRSIRR
jgi:hypothetical protein